ncbi:Pyrroline-5-carboxylate reductase [Cryptotermes secundus]|uniref:Pyrroline-5-carboxylate reductase n=1 Tax=Cryptotermes secundus TaxID=105785 RepID=A0A2J7QRD1_9NEOP|nr:pyrroline-5-carboxylate reductase [Cryptotermes secundus]PNF31136.1 Pyrroline-5-carboxylate reductase [Cryptotermes secundus]
MAGECDVKLSVKIGFIGAGNMAKAIGEGLANSGMIKPSQLYISAPSDKNLGSWKALGAHTSNKNGFVVEQSDIVFIAVKPQILDSAIENMKATLSQPVHTKLFVSVLAGTTLEVLEKKLCEVVIGARVIRVMPNTPMMVGAGVSVYSGGSNITSEDLSMIGNILSVGGISEMIPESLINAVGAVAGSGPAFVYIIIEALSDGAVKMGIPRNMATQLAAQTVFGAAKMVLQTGKHPARLKDEVCSAGGSTITGVHAMESGGVRNALMNAVEAAAKRSEELCPKK